MRRLLALLTMLVMPATAFAQHCDVASDTSLPAITATWHGTCTQGKAQGEGSAVFYGAAQKKLGGFYGIVKAGVPQLGVYEMEDGYKPVAAQRDLSDPQTQLDAFGAAEKAALATAAQFKAAGNQASADYYTQAARGLAEQHD